MSVILSFGVHLAEVVNKQSVDLDNPGRGAAYRIKSTLGHYCTSYLS